MWPAITFSHANSGNTFDLLRKFGQLTAGFITAELTQTLFSLKLACFYSSNISNSQAGAPTNRVLLLMAFLHVPLKSSLAGRKAPSNSGQNKTVRCSKSKAAVALGTV